MMWFERREKIGSESETERERGCESGRWRVPTGVIRGPARFRDGAGRSMGACAAVARGRGG
eukprot:265356-Chlamydomonas_euryale.AAC.1